MTGWFSYIALVFITSQLIFLLQAYKNYRFTIQKYRKERLYRPKTVLIVPCKGLEPSFEKNVTSFFKQDYANYLLWFVVADVSDPAYKELCRIKELIGKQTKALDVQVFVAGTSSSCSQKNHNLLYCYQRAGSDIEVLAFADSDICVHDNWLSHIVYPLHQSKNGAASGYRWFIPEKNNFASLALSAMNAKVGQLLGNTHFNQAWGGSMAIRLEVFRKLGLDKIWSKALSDDLSLSRAVKKAGMKVSFVPACLVASYEFTTWPKLIEFGRRQFLITRVAAPSTWWFGFLSSVYSVLGLWGGIGLAAYAVVLNTHNKIQKMEFLILLSLPVVFLLGQTIRAILRQKMIGKLLAEDRQRMKVACAADILLSWLWSLLLLYSILTSAFGKTIRWRGVRYRLLGPTETIVLDSQS